MTSGDLAEQSERLQDHARRTRHQACLIHKYAWRIQANAEGDMSERATAGGGTRQRRRWAGDGAAEGRDAATVTSSALTEDLRPVGSTIVRQYKGCNAADDCPRGRIRA